MLPTLRAEIDNILELIQGQKACEQELEETRAKIDALYNQIQEAYRELIPLAGRTAKNEALEVAVARLKLSELEKDILELHEKRHEFGFGSNEARSAAERELHLKEQAKKQRDRLQKVEWVRGGLTGAEEECRKSIEVARSELDALERGSDELISSCLEHERSIQLSVRKLRALFTKFDEIRSQSASIASALGLGSCNNEIEEWAQESLPFFEDNLRNIKRSLDDLRVKGISRAAPVSLLLSSEGLAYEDLETFVLERVPIFNQELCRSMIYHLSDDCLRALWVAMR